MGELAVRAPAVPRAAVTARVAGSTSLACGVLAVVLWLVAVDRADYGAMGPLGLVTILGPAFYLGLAVLVVGFVVELFRVHAREGRLVVLAVVLVLFLFGTPCAVEPIAALTSSWVHAGFVRYIFVHGHSLNGYDAEFSWPGAFSLGALLIAFMGKSNALGLLRWFPLVIELAYLAPLLSIARASGVSRRAGWLGIALFYATDWIYQDYFSPQALNYLFYLVTIAVVLKCWRPFVVFVERGRPGLMARVRSLRAVLTVRRLRGDDATTPWPSVQVMGMFLVLCLVFLASALSHQLTPYAIVLGLAACLVTRRLGRPELVVIAFLLAVGWLSLGASNYWLGHLSQIFGGLGNFLSSASQNVSNRVVGSSSHRLIVDARILLTLGLFGLAAIGALRRATDSRTLEVLAAVPFIVLAAQSYGGEGLLRVALLSGPFAALLAASAVLPSRTGAIRPFVPQPRLGRHGRVVLGIAAGVLLFGSAVTMTAVRGGNDYYETFTQGEVNAVNFAFFHAGYLDTVGLVAPYEPIGQWSVGTVCAYSAAPGASVPTVAVIEKNMLTQRPKYVILGQAQERWGEVLGGFQKGWMDAFQRFLLAHHYEVAGTFGTATVLRYTGELPPVSCVP